MLRLPALLLAAALLPAQVPPKENAAAYPAQAALGNYTLAAEYMVHSIPVPGGNIITEDYLVIEAAFFGPRYSQLSLSAEQFMLRVNGEKTPRLTQSPGIVAASVKYPEREQRRTLTLGAGPVIFGQPRNTGRFPGDPNESRPVPQVSQPPNPAGVEREPPPPVDEQIQLAAFRSGERELPTAGELFFPFKGKTKSIKSLELLYDGPAGKITVKLF